MRGEIKSFFVALFEFKAAPYAWYLAMYLGLYLMIPFLNEFIASKNGGGKYLCFDTFGYTTYGYE